MKKIKSLVLVALTLVMGLSMTSCLNSSEGSSVVYAYLRVEGGMMGMYHFEDQVGNKLYPTTASLSKVESSGDFKMSETKLAYIMFEFVEDNEQNTENYSSETTTSQSYDIELLGAMSLDGPEVVMSQTMADMDGDAPETAPVNSLEISNGYGQSAKPYLYDLEILVLPIQFNLSNDNDKFKMHQLVLACCREEMEGATDMVFYLRHDKGGDDGITYYYSQWYAYDISRAISEFQSETGVTPEKLIIRAHEDINQTGEMPEEYTEYEVEYKTSTVED